MDTSFEETSGSWSLPWEGYLDVRKLPTQFDMRAFMEESQMSKNSGRRRFIKEDSMDSISPVKLESEMESHDMKSLVMLQERRIPENLDAMSGLFNLTSDQVKLKVHFRRKMTQAEKVEYRKRRLLRACEQCRMSKRRCTHGPKHVDASPAARLRCPRLQIPISEDSRLSGYLSYELGSGTFQGHQLRMFGAWTSHLPARVGQSKALDSAVESLIAAHEGRLSHNTKTANDCSRKYTAAISNVREAVLREPYSDNTLLAVGLCVSTEYSMRQLFAAMFLSCRKFDLEDGMLSHSQGLTALLQNRLRQGKATDMMRAMFYADTSWGFDESCALGIASPFDHPTWLDIMPLRSESRLPSIQLLKKHAKQSFIQLPRLISYVRALRSGVSSTDSEIAVRANDIAMDLYFLDASQGETDILHNVKITRTLRPQDAAIIPWSLQFNDFDEFEAAVAFWTARLLLLNVCQSVRAIPELNFIATADELSAEQERILTNVMMSWQYVYSLQAETNASLPISCFPSAIWSALIGKTGEFCGHPVSIVKRLVLQRLDEFTGVLHAEGDDPFDDTVLTQDALMLAGGPLKGSPTESRRGDARWC